MDRRIGWQVTNTKRFANIRWVSKLDATVGFVAHLCTHMQSIVMWYPPFRKRLPVIALEQARADEL